MPFCKLCDEYNFDTKCNCKPFRYTFDLSNWTTVYANSIKSAVESISKNNREFSEDENDIFDDAPPIFYIDGKFRCYQASVELTPVFDVCEIDIPSNVNTSEIKLPFNKKEKEQ